MKVLWSRGLLTDGRGGVKAEQPVTEQGELQGASQPGVFVVPTLGGTLSQAGPLPLLLVRVVARVGCGPQFQGLSSECMQAGL